MPLVSVIMPAYNSAQTLDEAVSSVLSQTFSDWELIIVDDASQDETARLACGWAEKDRRIRLVQNDGNLGVAASRNRGCALAAGVYIAFLDSDDRWLPQKLERQAALLETAGAGLCYSSYLTHNPALPGRDRLYRVPPAVDYQGLLRENVVGCSTVLLRRELLKDGFPSGYFHEDYVLWLRLLREGCTFCGIAEPLVIYRTGGRSANKFRAARHRWDIYRRSERLSFPASLYYLLCYFFLALRKRMPSHA